MMKGGMAGLMKQAQQMQEKMAKMQEELANAEVTGKDLEMLEALFAAAVNDAVRKIEANSQDKMSGVTAGMQLPPGMKLPF